ncbi:hypothetical protein FDP41_008762 [Naegleria fowleri]|uniref:Major facilitator superfamily (MFS) profile domain-containing protein n=1 Tax=Naegleria fowleri TaxID=5763 RepID=A0A6A5BFW9_NAEFO|nr:uncharacterized protein FDP41_008762 [Naegleria fowleri]KAF0972910.1 hypothetical protein FDP41_008762 [Naegleria fowleri]
MMQEEDFMSTPSRGGGGDSGGIMITSSNNNNLKNNNLNERSERSDFSLDLSSSQLDVEHDMNHRDHVMDDGSGGELASSSLSQSIMMIGTGAGNGIPSNHSAIMMGEYGQLDAESSKPVLKRNPYLSLLFHNKRFMIIWMAGVLSGMGNYFSEIGVIYEVENRATFGFATGALFISIFAPSCLAMPFAGVCSDLFDRRKVLIIANILRGIVAFCLPFGFLVQNLGNGPLFAFYYLEMFLIFFINAFYDACRGCLMPLVVDHHDLIACNALDSLTWLFCSYAGAAIGGFVRAAFGLLTVYLVNGFLFVAALLLTIWLMWFPELNPPKPANTLKGLALMKHSFVELFQGFKLLFGGKGYLFSFAIMKLVGSFIWASVEFINVKISEFPTITILNSPEDTNTIAYCLFGVGSGIAPMLCELLLGNRIRRSVRSAFWLRFVILVCFLFIPLGFLLMSFTVHASMFVIGNFILGSAGGVIWVYSMSAIEQLTPNHFLGRITAFDICFGFGAGQALGVMVPSPLLYDFIGLKQPHLFALVMFCIGWVVFVMWVVWFYLTRNIDQHHHQQVMTMHDDMEIHDNNK